MITYDKLKIYSDRIEIENLTSDKINDSFKITGIVICSPKNFSGNTGPADNIICSHPCPACDSVTRTFTTGDIKDGTTSFYGRFIVVYLKIQEGDTVVYDYCCAVNWEALYKIGTKYISSLIKTGCCKVPKEFIDFILKDKAIQYLIQDNKVIEASNLWDTIFGVEGAPDCPCNN